MTGKRIFKIGIVALFVGGFFLAFNLMSKPEAANENNVLPLQAPPFISTVMAAPSIATTASFLEDEAGIAAYTQTAGSIDLSLVRDVFRTIEYETADYIIGSVEVPDYPEDHDVHVYVHANGWVVAYYRAEEPAAKIIDLRHYDGVGITTTKLKMAMQEILVVVGIVTFDTSYYDFRYPNATKLMLIAERYDGTYNYSFDLQLPDTFTFYERSWTHYCYNCDYPGSSILYLNDVVISELDTSGYGYNYGAFTPAQLPPLIYHELKITTGEGAPSIGVTLVYNEGS